MSGNCDEKARETVNIIKSYTIDSIELERIKSEKFRERDLLKDKIISYVRVIYSDLFDWSDIVNKELLKDRIGRICISLDEEQSRLFPDNIIDFYPYEPKKFTVLTGSVSIDFSGVENIKLDAKVEFGADDGSFQWDDGSVNMFFSKRHLAMDDLNFGEKNIRDILSLLGTRVTFSPKNQNFITFEDPIDIINRKIRERMSRHYPKF